MKNRLAPLALVLLLLSGCAGYTLVKGGENANVGGTFEVTPAMSWNKTSQGKFETWTLDGPGLQELLFVEGISDGDLVFPAHNPNASALEKAPRFKKGMSSLEIVELYEAALAFVGSQQVKITNLHPHPVGKTPGFAFDLTMKTKSGLEKSGTAIGAVKDDRLYMLMYFGATLYYFDRGKPDVERMFRSVVLL